jgi:hypothetical protein
MQTLTAEHLPRPPRTVNAWWIVSFSGFAFSLICVLIVAASSLGLGILINPSIVGTCALIFIGLGYMFIGAVVLFIHQWGDDES